MTTHNLSDAEVPNLTCWVHWPEGDFPVELKYLSSVDRDKLIKDCLIRTFDRASRQPIENTDENKFRRKLADLIVNWKDLTAAKARKFYALDQKIDNSFEFQCTPENRLFAITRFKDFPTWVIETSMELHLSVERKMEEEEKNS